MQCSLVTRGKMKIFAMVDNGGWRKIIGVLVKLVSSNKPKKKTRKYCTNPHFKLELLSKTVSKWSHRIIVKSIFTQRQTPPQWIQVAPADPHALWLHEKAFELFSVEIIPVHRPRFHSNVSNHNCPLVLQHS